MTCDYLGGRGGSWLGARAYTYLGWPGVCTLLALLAVIALARHLASSPATGHPQSTIATQNT
jgi:predicted MFS family arabinose efflux permease